MYTRFCFQHTLGDSVTIQEILLNICRRSFVRLSYQGTVEMSWCYDRRLVGLSVLVSGTSLGPMTRGFVFLSFAGQLLCSLSWGALYDERTGLKFVVQCVGGQSLGRLINVYYCLIWDYWVPFLSFLTTRRDFGGSILTSLHTENQGTKYPQSCLSNTIMIFRSTNVLILCKLIA
jgi:hypothetical protein